MPIATQLMRLLALLALSLAAAKEGQVRSGASSAFVAGLASRGGAGVVIEVGANTGAFSDRLMRRCRKGLSPRRTG